MSRREGRVTTPLYHSHWCRGVLEEWVWVGGVLCAREGGCGVRGWV